MKGEEKMEKRILVKENGITNEISFSKKEVEIIKSDRTHLCGTCTYCTPLDCKKVKDAKKQTIDKYDFITEGKEYIIKDISRYIIFCIKLYTK